jgi:hypothetical protein
MVRTFHELYGTWMPGSQTQSALGQQDFMADVAQELVAKAPGQ